MDKFFQVSVLFVSTLALIFCMTQSLFLIKSTVANTVQVAEKKDVWYTENYNSHVMS